MSVAGRIRPAGPPDFGPVLTTAEAAGYLRISVRQLQDRADIPRLDIAPPGAKKAQWRYRRQDLERFVAEKLLNPYETSHERPAA